MKVDNRTRLIAEVKAIGQEIIEQAENIVGEGGNMVGTLTVSATFTGGPEISLPTLDISREQYAKTIEKLYMDGEII